jgi:hypothetical protein
MNSAVSCGRCARPFQEQCKAPRRCPDPRLQRRGDHPLGDRLDPGRPRPTWLCTSSTTASTDESPAILAEIAATDPRVHVHRKLNGGSRALHHPPAADRRARCGRYGGGYRHVHYGEDSDLYWRLQEKGRPHNLSEILWNYRMHDASISGESIVNGRIMAVSPRQGGL